jgi:glutamate dehydrogenase
MRPEAQEGTARGRTSERLRALLERKASGPDAARLATFAKLLLARQTGYVTELEEEEAAALVLSAYRFFAGPGPSLRVRALTPDYAHDGWDAPVSIVEAILGDRPFIVDTVREELRAQGFEAHTLLHPIFAVRRDPTGALESLAAPVRADGRESFLHVAIPRLSDRDRLAQLAADVHARLEDVQLVTDDFAAMRERALATAAELDTLSGGPRATEAASAAELLRWLVDGGLVFLGARDYAVTDGTVQMRSGSGMGLLRRESNSAFLEPRRLGDLSPAVRMRLDGRTIVTVAKTLARSPVHRRAPMDDIGVVQLDSEGRVVGERRFVGLLTSKARAEEAADVPLLRRTLRQVLTAEQAVEGSHDWKEIVAVFNTMPKGVLFASTPAVVRADVDTVVTAARSDDVVVSVQPLQDGARLGVLVVMPEAQLSGAARPRIEALVAERFGGVLLEEYLHVGDGARARLHLLFAPARPPSGPGELSVLRAAIAAAVQAWGDRLRDVAEDRLGQAAALHLVGRWGRAFPPDYRASVEPERALTDIEHLEAVIQGEGTQVAFADADHATALRVYVDEKPLVLADVLPVLEHLGLRTLNEDCVHVTAAGQRRFYLHRFLVQDRQGRPLDLAVAPPLRDALLAVWRGQGADDVLNRLVLEAGLDWRAVDCLRTYAGWAVQAGLARRTEVLSSLVDHPRTAAALFACFAARFRPDGDDADPRAAFLASLETVPSLRQDAILRGLLAAVDATVRTNFFARAADVDWVSIKLRSADLALLPSPRPLYEIYVAGRRVEGIHLRAGRIARGGIRLSDRPDDFRTEVLGLMKTQTVKNAVIVPTGAKGGFVPKPGTPAPDAYRVFIGALLDLTDDLVEGGVVHPRGLVVRDEPDPYFVVAADKGTATFSDLANAIAVERRFWLGDAFASGGSQGYDHKALGITARGAWECTRTHFREMGVDVDRAPIDVVGIGDMGGDVFGNGLLRSRALRLRAAFNHRHVFLDPDPDPERSFAERRRLFDAVKGWDAYDRAVLSRGGMIVERAAKQVPVTPEVRAMLGIVDDAPSGEALVRAVLRMDADLLWNGGIGTYVRAADETAAQVGDPANDSVRITADELRVRVVGEGGNLGFTQRARIAYALAGGRINTDAVDNSAGVDCSDHEVNLKIALQPLVESRRLDVDARNALLDAMCADVVAHVLAHNQRQSRLLGVDQLRSRTRLSDFRDHQADLERTAGLDRVLESLPDRTALRARRGTFLGLARPELAVLMAYTKLGQTTELLASPVVDDPLFEPHLQAYFPERLVTEHSEAVRGHRLRREIIATQVANALVDAVGTTFVHRVRRAVGVTVPEVVRGWGIAWSVLDGAALLHDLEAAEIAVDEEIGCRIAVELAAEQVTRWVLRGTDPTRAAVDVAAELREAIAPACDALSAWVVGGEAESLQKRIAALEIAGLAPPVARRLALAEWMPVVLDVVTAARTLGLDVATAGARWGALGGALDFRWLLARLGEIAAEDDRWQQRAAEALADDLQSARRRLVALPDAVEAARALGPVQGLLRDLRAAPKTTLAALLVVAREIRRVSDPLTPPARPGEGHT